MEVEKLVKMFEKEKESLENQINDKTNRLEEIKKEQENIIAREEIIKRYNEAIENLKFNKSLIKFDAYLIILFTSLLILFASTFIPMSITVFIALGFAVISFLFTAKKYMIEYFENKKVIKNNKKEYKESKENEDKDKELELSLTEEYTRIEQDILPLQYRLSRLKKVEAMQKLGYELELKIFKYKDQEESLTDMEKEQFYNQLWETSLEEKDYKKVHLYNNRIESGQILRKKL